VFRAKYSIGSADEALGLASGEPDRAKTRATLLARSSDLRLTQRERDEIRDQMLGLRGPLAEFCDKRGGDGRRRMDVENIAQKRPRWFFFIGRSSPAVA